MPPMYHNGKRLRLWLGGISDQEAETFYNQLDKDDPLRQMYFEPCQICGQERNHLPGCIALKDEATTVKV